LIFVDDFSVDNSFEIVQKMQKKDKRIKLIKNKKNMGTLYSRYIGQLNSNAEYMLFIDCDDFILKDGIYNSYKYTEKNNIDIIQFYTIRQDKKRIFIRNFGYNYKKIIYQPYLSYIFYYNIKTKKGDEINFGLWNKLIKREVVNKAFKWIGKKYLKEKIVVSNDLIIIFSLFKNAKSYRQLDEIGYYYYFQANNKSASNSYKNYMKSNEIIHGLFTNIKFLFEKTGNNYFDKYYFQLINFLPKSLKF
jgi:glycosyltransferase involved in cell wall biosynthesis